MSRFLSRACVFVVLVWGLSSCIVTGLVTTHYFHASGGLDHEARVAAAWRGAGGELALALEDLEGVYRTRDALLVFTPAELEQMFAGVANAKPGYLPVPHVPMPRSVLARGLTLERPPPGSRLFLPVAEWDSRRELDGARFHALPEPLSDAPFSVHWTHHYITGAAVESGFALLLTRRTNAGVQHALLLPEPFRPPWWPNAIVVLAVLVDVTWMTLLIAG
jgi:hypothetical protein